MRVCARSNCSSGGNKCGVFVDDASQKWAAVVLHASGGRVENLGLFETQLLAQTAYNRRAAMLGLPKGLVMSDQYSLEHRLTSFLRKHDPRKVSKASDMSVKYADREARLNEKLLKKYSASLASPHPCSSSRSGVKSEDGSTADSCDTAAPQSSSRTSQSAASHGASKATVKQSKDLFDESLWG